MKIIIIFLLYSDKLEQNQEACKNCIDSRHKAEAVKLEQINPKKLDEVICLKQRKGYNLRLSRPPHFITQMMLQVLNEIIADQKIYNATLIY